MLDRRLPIVCVLCIVALPAPAFAAKGGKKGAATQPAAATSMPSGENVVVLQKKLQDADAAIVTAQRELEKIGEKLRPKFESSQEWTDAQAALKQAQADRDAAVKPVLDRVHQSDAYKSALATKQKTSAELTRLRAATPPASDPQIADATKASLDAAQAVAQLENDAVANDAGSKEASAKLALAAAKVGQLRQQFQASIKSSDEYKQAKQAIADAKSAREQTAKDLADAVAQYQKDAAQAEAEAKERREHPNVGHGHGGGGGGRHGRPRVIPSKG
jgi:hypothetical protein